MSCGLFARSWRACDGFVCVNVLSCCITAYNCAGLISASLAVMASIPAPAPAPICRAASAAAAVPMGAS